MLNNLKRVYLNISGKYDFTKFRVSPINILNKILCGCVADVLLVRTWAKNLDHASVI